MLGYWSCARWMIRVDKGEDNVESRRLAGDSTGSHGAQLRALERWEVVRQVPRLGPMSKQWMWLEVHRQIIRKRGERPCRFGPR
jgi:hypothetical protein